MFCFNCIGCVFSVSIDCYQFVFFFSSRRRHTRLTCDWSSDVCSSDLAGASSGSAKRQISSAASNSWGPVWAAPGNGLAPGQVCPPPRTVQAATRAPPTPPRSEERRVGKECRSRWSPEHEKKKELVAHR